MASEVKNRLLEYLGVKGITQLEFTRRLGVSSTYIGAMRRSLSDAKVARIRQLFPDLNTSWLLYGEGDMLNERDAAPSADDGYLVPLLPVAAFAGNLQLWSEGVNLDQCEKIRVPIHGVDFAIRISGDSMEPALHNGSMLYIKRINDRAFVPWGNMMVIDTENGVLVKSVYPDRDDSSFIVAKSVNPNYPPLRIPSESIFGLYRILGSSTVYSTM